VSFHLPQLSLSKLSTLCAFSICFAVIFGAGALVAPAPQEAPPSFSTLIVAATRSAEVATPNAEVAAQTAEVAAQTAEPNVEENAPDLSRFVAEMMAVSFQMGATVPSPSPANPDQDGAAAATPQQQATFVGIWAPDASSCSLRNFRDGLLPTVMNLDGASAGDTFCSFKNLQQMQTGWRMDAHCSNKQEQWSTRVYLSVNGDRMIWKSKRGSQAYTRCTNDLRMAQVH
jgi:hypothetical protein